VLVQAEEPPSKPSRRRKKKKASGAAEATSPQPAPTPVPEPEEPSYNYLPSRPKMVRSGALLHTGDSMPNTEFYRPNPLDSDVIMDATARLLAPRKLTLSPSRPAPAPEATKPAEVQASNAAKKRKKKEKAADAAPVSPAPPTVAKTAPVPEASPTKKRKRKKKATKPAEATPLPVSAPETQPAAPKTQRKKKRSPHRGPATEPRRSQAKDSTEQKSLMKPYYLDMGN